MNKLIKYLPRVITGLMMLLFGLDKLMPFMPHPPADPAGVAFKEALVATGYFFKFVGLSEIFVGAALLSGYFIPLALLVMAPLCIHFILYHIFLDPANIAGALMVTGLGLFIAWQNREIYKPFLKLKSE
jgi:uncharacterized membrane protein YphA (DoxX/SURF4 family)